MAPAAMGVVRFSVVVPTYNRAAMLRGLLERLMALEYPREAFEVIVVDDASPDETPRLLAELQQRWPLRHLRHPHNRGQAAGRNWGIGEARGEFVAFTDDDCLPPPDWLARLQRLFERYPWCAGVGGLPVPTLVRTVAGRFWLARREAGPQPGDEPREVTRERFVSPVTNNVAYRREVLLRLGGFHEELRYGEDADLNWRLLEMGERLLLDPSLHVSHRDPEGIGELWQRHLKEGAALFPFLLRRGGGARLLRVALRRTLVLLASLCPIPGLWWPVFALVPALYLGLLLVLRRRVLARARGGEKVAFALLLALQDLATSLGFAQGVLRHWRWRRAGAPSS